MAGAAAAVNVYSPIPAFSTVTYLPAAGLHPHQVRQILRASISTCIRFCDVTRQKFERDRQKRLTPNILRCYTFISCFDQIVIESVWNFARREPSVSRKDLHYFNERGATLITALQCLFRAITTTTTRQTEGEFLTVSLV